MKRLCGPALRDDYGASLIQSGCVQGLLSSLVDHSPARHGISIHLEKGIPILEDVLGKLSVIFSRAKTGEPVCNRFGHVSPGSHGTSRQAMADRSPRSRWRKRGMKLTDVDHYAVELRRSGMPRPRAAATCPELVACVRAAAGGMRGQIRKDQIEDFCRTRGRYGYAPNQGRVPRRLFTSDTRWMRSRMVVKMRFYFQRKSLSRPYDAAFRRLLVFSRKE